MTPRSWASRLPDILCLYTWRAVLFFHHQQFAAVGAPLRFTGPVPAGLITPWENCRSRKTAFPTGSAPRFVRRSDLAFLQAKHSTPTSLRIGFVFCIPDILGTLRIFHNGPSCKTIFRPHFRLYRRFPDPGMVIFQSEWAFSKSAAKSR